jgi:hypothetical protein
MPISMDSLPPEALAEILLLLDPESARRLLESCRCVRPLRDDARMWDRWLERRHSERPVDALRAACRSGMPALVRRTLGRLGAVLRDDDELIAVPPIPSCSGDVREKWREYYAARDRAGRTKELRVAEGTLQELLEVAARDGHAGVVRALIEGGAPVSRRGMGHGGTALHFACAGGRYDVIAALVEAGADEEARDELGFTPAQLQTFFNNRGSGAEAPPLRRCKA